jgi:fatty acyl-CoA reductase
MVRRYEKLHRAVNSFEYFMTRSWNFSINNVMMLNDQLEGVDKVLFNFDIRQLDWPNYWEDYVLGIRKHILKEEDSSLPKARRKLRRMYFLPKIIGFIFLFLIFVGFLLAYVFTSDTMGSHSIAHLNHTNNETLMIKI